MRQVYGVKRRDMKLETEYKGFIIRWDDYSRKFNIYQHDATCKKDLSSLEDCEKWIDAKTKQKYVRVPIMFTQKYGWGKRDLKIGEATSILNENDKTVWVSDGKDRHTTNCNSVYLATEANKATYAEIQKLEVQKYELEDKIETAYKSMELLTLDMLIPKQK